MVIQSHVVSDILISVFVIYQPLRIKHNETQVKMHDAQDYFKHKIITSHTAKRISSLKINVDLWL